MRWVCASAVGVILGAGSPVDPSGVEHQQPPVVDNLHTVKSSIFVHHLLLILSTSVTLPAI
jgi:hypothetical protein